MIAREDLEHVLTLTRPLWSDVRGARIFITGGTGFVGSWLLESFVFANRALELDASAVVLSRDPEAFRARAPHLTSDPAIELIAGDGATFNRPAGDFPFIIHAATERFYEPDDRRPLGILEDDFQATKHVLEFARVAKTKRLLFTSSGAVYGRQPPDMSHVAEDYAGAPGPGDRHAVYGYSKRLSEYCVTQYARQYGFAAPIARLFAFVGPLLPSDQGYAVCDFLGDVLDGSPIKIAGDGTPLRSYLYAADLAVWLWTILLRGQSCRPYNVGSPHALTIADLARQVAAATLPHTPVEIAGQPVPGAPAARYVPSTLRAENELGLVVRIPLDEGIRRTYRWHRRAVPMER